MTKPLADLAASAHAATAALSGVKRVIVVSDLYRVDDRVPDRLAPPGAINTRWIFELFGPPVGALLGVPSLPLIEFDYPDPMSRISVYRRLGREFTSAGWASLFDDLDDQSTENELADRFTDALVIAYEMPPYLRLALSRHNIPYIDLFIHPVRFLPDYIFGIRSNVRSVYDRLCETEIPDEVVAGFARVSTGRTARTHRSAEPETGSAIFFGQIKVDSSLIANGQIAAHEDVEAALLELASQYPVVYYKPHPYVEDADALKARLSKLPKLKWVTWNPYDILALQRVGICASLSSGTLHEARYFEMPTKRFLAERLIIPAPDTHIDQAFVNQLYRRSPPAVFDPNYWRYILGLSDNMPNLRMPDATDGALKFSLNMKWGR